MKGTTFEGAFRVPAFMWAPGRISPGSVNSDIIGHIDAWPTLAAMAGLTPPPHGEWKDNAGNPIYFDGIDQSARILGRSDTPPRMTWVYMRGLELQAVRYGDWKWNWSSQDAWLGPRQDSSLPAIYNLTMDPAEHYDMAFNGAAPRVHGQFSNSPGRWSGQDGGWTMAFAGKVMDDVVETFRRFPNIPTTPSGASLGADIPEFSRPNILVGEYPEVHAAIKRMRLDRSSSGGDDDLPCTSSG
jgi:arylsulfatase